MQHNPNYVANKFEAGVCMFRVIVGIVLICVLALSIRQWKENKRKQEVRRKMEEESARRKKEFEIFVKKRKKRYCEYLPQIYQSYSSKKLVSAYNCLSTMHRNDFKVEDAEFSPSTVSTYWSACDELKSILGFPKWKVLNGKGGMDVMDHPLFPTEDMNFVRLLCSRGIWRR